MKFGAASLLMAVNGVNVQGLDTEGVELKWHPRKIGRGYSSEGFVHDGGRRGTGCIDW